MDLQYWPKVLERFTILTQRQEIVHKLLLFIRLWNLSFSLIIMSGKRLFVEQRAEIPIWYPTKSIGELAKVFHLSKSSVRNIIKKKQNLGTVADLPRFGRARIPTTRKDRCLVRFALRNRFHTSATLKHLWAIQCSRRTIRLRRLLSAGLRGCISTMKPSLTVFHRQKRLEWCKLRQNWTVEQWRPVIFSDESAF